MAKTEPTTEAAPAAASSDAKPAPAPSARDVVQATSTIVNAIEHLPPPLQVRALIAAGTALGLQLVTRGNEQPRQQQQRPPQQPNNGQRSGAR